jgi:hypothetical protein
MAQDLALWNLDGTIASSRKSLADAGMPAGTRFFYVGAS